MKTLLIILSISTITSAHASLNECFRDAKTHGSHTRSLSPVMECADLLKSHPQKIEARSSDGKYLVYGLGEMLYVESNEKKELLAGDQTGLKNIIKVEINENKKRLLVLQKDSVSTFNLEFIGNVSPLRQYKSPLLKHASRVKLLDNEDMIAILGKSGVSIINADAESRWEIEKLKPKILNEVKGPQSLIKNPSDVLIHSEKIYVLDSDRVLVFSKNAERNSSPEKVLSLSSAISLKIKDNKALVVNSTGQEFLLP